jgi:cytochrome c oxidase subunit I
MHIVGLQGQPRRMYRYDVGLGYDLWNKIETIGAFTIALGVLIFIINALRTIRGPKAELDPWDARSLEWLTSSPPPAHNYDSVPTVHSIDEFFHRKYEEDEAGELHKVATAEELYASRTIDEHIHMPSPSYWPMAVAFLLPVIAMGIIFNCRDDLHAARRVRVGARAIHGTVAA